MQQFLNYLHTISNLSEAAKSAIGRTLERKEYPKNHVLIPDLARCDKLYFVEKGLTRAFYLKDDREVTDWFGAENSLIGPVTSHLEVKTALHTVTVLEESTLVHLHLADIELLYAQYPEIERLGRLIAVQTIVMLQSKIEAMLFLSAKQRYDHFVKMHPTLLQRVALGHIASYLGINQVTLSRIRKSKA